MGARILIVDDHADGAWSLAQLLEIEGYTTLTALPGQDALLRFRSFRPKLLILDLDMPVMNGFELAKAIRHETEGETPVLIALSGWDTPGHRKRARETGFDAYIVKPVKPVTFLTELAELIRSADSK
jgi:CheY-like chemotaxis protein